MKTLHANIAMSAEVSDETYEKVQNLIKAAEKDKTMSLAVEHYISKIFSENGYRDGESLMMRNSHDNPNRGDFIFRQN